MLAIVLIILYLLFVNKKEGFQEEDEFALLCKSNLDFYRANEEVCKTKVGSECSVKSYMMDNNEACRLLGYEPCSIFEYLKEHKDECRKIVNPSTNKPYDACNFVEYFKDNKSLCRKNGIDACSYESQYLYDNIPECRLEGTEICKADKNYLMRNPEECRKYGIEPCKEQDFRYSRTEDCMNLGFDVCSETDFLKSPKAIICGLGKEGVINDKTSPCGYDEFLNLSKTNKDLCCSKGKLSVEQCMDNNPCKTNEIYIKNNTELCRRNGFEPCVESTSYRLDNPLECKDQGFNPCASEKYYAENLTECKDSLKSCANEEYRNKNQEECSKKL